MLRQKVVSEQGTASLTLLLHTITIYTHIDKHPTIPTITIIYFIIITRYYNDYHSDCWPLIVSFGCLRSFRSNHLGGHQEDETKVLQSLGDILVALQVKLGIFTRRNGSLSIYIISGDFSSKTAD